uniref:Uncharacterized protein n=1 Tax=Zea mays TaxID=4577 RepID=C4JC72_MAIZE|nr:unknown [Zea mays]
MAAANGDACRSVGGVPRPTNPMVTPLLTDLYQFTMAYAYWKAGKHLDRAVLALSPSSSPLLTPRASFVSSILSLDLGCQFTLNLHSICGISLHLPPGSSPRFVVC